MTIFAVQDGAGGRGRGRIAWGAAAVIALVAGLAVTARNRYSELPCYELAAARMLRGESIYRQDERAFTYPPLFAVPFVPLVMLPEAARPPIWSAVNWAVLVVIVWRLNRLLRPGMAAAGGTPPGGRAAPTWLFWLLAALLAGRHVSAPLENQSHDLIVFLCAVLAIDASGAPGRRAELLAGFWAGLGTALKATPLLFAPVFLWQRRFVAALTLGVALAGLTFLPDLLFPAQDHTSWTVSWYATFLKPIKPGETAVAIGAWYPWNQLNQSLAGTIYRLVTPFPDDNPDQSNVSVADLSPAALKYLTVASQLAAGLWLLWVTRPGLTRGLPDGERTFRRLGEGAALVTAMTLLSPTSIKTHFCVLLLPITFCLADFLYRRRDWLTGAALVVVFVLGSLTVKGLLGRTAGNWVLASGSVTWCTLAVYAATGRVLLQRARTHPPTKAT